MNSIFQIYRRYKRLCLIWALDSDDATARAAKRTGIPIDELSATDISRWAEEGLMRE